MRSEGSTFHDCMLRSSVSIAAMVGTLISLYDKALSIPPDVLSVVCVAYNRPKPRLPTCAHVTRSQHVS